MDGGGTEAGERPVTRSACGRTLSICKHSTIANDSSKLLAVSHLNKRAKPQANLSQVDELVTLEARTSLLDTHPHFATIVDPTFQKHRSDMYAIIRESGKQFKVTSGDRIRIDREATDEKTVTFGEVLFVGGEGEPKIGAPLLSGATVVADVLGEVKGPKLTIQKYKRRKGYHKKIGHRQHYLEVKVTAINV